MGYLDSASAEPLQPAAREAFVSALDRTWADPARLYGAGRRSALLLDAARSSIATALAARADEVSFTSSGTTAAHLAVLGSAVRLRERGRHLIVSAVEHSSVLSAARSWEQAGGTVTTLAVDGHGRVDAAALQAALRPDTVLVSVQHGNPEVGTLQPIAEIAALCGQHDVELHVDAAQSVGRLAVPTGWSLLTASAHKWGGPPGVGVLVVRRGSRWRPPWPDDEREGGRVAGPVSLPAVVAAAAALDVVGAGMVVESARLSALTARLRRDIVTRVPDVELVGAPDERLPHIVAFSCLYVDGESLVLGLDRRGYAVHSGSACTASALRPSHVLTAMGVLTHGNVRVSLPRGTRQEELDGFLVALAEEVAQLRAEAGVGDL